MATVWATIVGLARPRAAMVLSPYSDACLATQIGGSFHVHQGSRKYFDHNVYYQYLIG